MRAALADGTGGVSLTTLDDPTPGPADVIVQLDSCGICGTDLHIIDGDYPAARTPIVPGHEIAGTVVARGRDVDHLDEGTFVVVDPVVECGHCPPCRAGKTNLCANWQGYGVTLPGGFADYIRVRAVDAAPVPASIPRKWATLIEPVSCVLHALDRIGTIHPGDTALVIGAGPTGLILSQLLAASGARVDVVDRNPERHSRAAHFGAHRTAADHTALDQPGGWDLVVEATGSVGGFEAGLAAVRQSGRFHVFGVSSPEATAKVSPYAIFAKELTITGSQSLQNTFGRAVHTLAAGAIDGEALVTARVPLADIDKALDLVRRGDGIKTQITRS
ncbi:alcohol dehydrogenase catalytic domain-containing protein [Rhodococcus opacus]|uniref:alcohol dehydrogenase catalytic domain-containing protein n=1 Tax=Rhodococcus opacus TaxID=37919 RepID=UPI001C446635|nr:alcohol dehydrogenase catalytic domain-containing protein [Rhodococcus opacus]MBV6760202.1 alcohol dehydrogenase catalytic domain-containing protein [Rhodococcus opacus]